MPRRCITITWDDDEGLSDEETLFAFEKGEFDIDDLLFLGDSVNLVTTCATLHDGDEVTATSFPHGKDAKWELR